LGRISAIPGADGPLADYWYFDEGYWVLTRQWAAVGFQRDDLDETQMTYDDARPGCYLRPERLADMDVNGIEASLCFPNYSRFAGQHFLDVEDRELGLACVRAYNYWMVEEWCEGSGGRLIPPVHRAALGSRPGGRGGLPQSGSRCPSGVLHRAPQASRVAGYSQRPLGFLLLGM
jgi:hypothetical protein